MIDDAYVIHETRITRRAFLLAMMASVGCIPNRLANDRVQMQDDNPITLEPFYINNRRYLGNKYKLLKEIRAIVDKHCPDVETFVDIFAGTGAVASAFTDKQIVTNDLLYSNTICHQAWFSCERYDKKKLEALLKAYNVMSVTEDNYVSDNFADTYFSLEDCRKIGFIREDIEARATRGELSARERALLITSLLYAMDKIANTCGHYDAYRKDVEFKQRLRLRLPVPPKCVHSDNQFYTEDANVLAKRLVADLVFMDPPYNSRQYSDSYHLLENIARWEKPEVKGVARKMDRSALKSDYCTNRAEIAFEALVRSVRAKYIILTYNNMEDKGDERSNAKLSDEAIFRILRAKGEVQVFMVEHKAFSAGKSDRDDNMERIFLCTCRPETLVASPLNYTGGKFKILDQLLPHFPKKIGTCVDLFCGGCNVGVNVVANRVVMVDACVPLIDLFKTLQSLSAQECLEAVNALIERFNLSQSRLHGYEFYNCDSSKGLAKYNRTAFLKLRDYYATLKDGTEEKAIVLYVLIVYAFNNQLRFNDQGDFNLPVGKRDFNNRMEAKLVAFVNRLKERDFVFVADDFRAYDVSTLGMNDFVYADPPYLVTTAAYNENGGWTEKDEHDLLALLDRLHRQGCKFALSNVTESNGRRNEILLKWIEGNRNYRVIEIDRDYSNANYHRRKTKRSREILVLNH